jgi:hypothetical protein
MMGTYQKQIHLLAPILCGILFEPAGWPGNRLILIVHKCGDGNVDIQAVQEVKKFFGASDGLG